MIHSKRDEAFQYMLMKQAAVLIIDTSLATTTKKVFTKKKFTIFKDGFSSTFNLKN